MRALYKAVIALLIVVVVAVVAVVALGVVGVIRLPGVSPATTTYAGGTEIQNAQQIYNTAMLLSGKDSFPSYTDLLSYGLEIHLYGTNDGASVVNAYYDMQTAGWDVVEDDSGPGWYTTIWRNNLYGFALIIGEHFSLQQLAGYNTVYLTIDGPALAWAQVFSQFD